MAGLEWSVRQGLLRNLTSQLFTRLFSNIGVRLLQVPILLRALGGDDYGRWLLLSTVPAWLALSNLGFGTVAGNGMLMSVASGDLKRASTCYAAAWKAALLATAVLLTPVLAGTLLMPVEHWVGIGSDRAWEVRTGLCYLCLSVLLSLFTEVLSLRLRAGRRSDAAAYLNGLQLWVELLLVGWVAWVGAGFDRLGLANLASTVVGILLTFVAGRGLLPGLRFDRRAAGRRDVFGLLRQGLQYQSLPMGHALILQGQLMAVHAALGSAAVAVFGTTRTLVRLASQSTELVNHSVWPEMSRLFGRGETERAARLHRLSVIASLATALVASLVLGVAGRPLYAWWTDGILDVDGSLLLCLLASVPFNALWYTSSMVHLSCNRYGGLAWRYLAAAALSLAACRVMASAFGLPGAALSTLVCDALMIPFVLSVSLRLTGDKASDMAGRMRADLASLYLFRRWGGKG